MFTYVYLHQVVIGDLTMKRLLIRYLLTLSNGDLMIVNSEMQKVLTERGLLN